MVLIGSYIVNTNTDCLIIKSSPRGAFTKCFKTSIVAPPFSVFFYLSHTYVIMNLLLWKIQFAMTESSKHIKKPRNIKQTNNKNLFLDP